MSNIFQWQLHGDGKTLAPGEVVEPDERLTWVRTAGIGAQHVIAMFGATFLVPILTGFDPSTTLFFTAMSTALFLLINRNVLPSYLGSSFGFIAPITAVTTANKGIAVASFGIMVTGILLALVGVLVHYAGSKWIDIIMPPVVNGAIVAIIGFNLAPSVWTNFQAAPDTALVTLLAVLLVAVLFKGLLGRLNILVGVIIGYVYACIRGQVDFSAIGDAAWIGFPKFHLPQADFSILPMFIPVVLVLVAENVGHEGGADLVVDRKSTRLNSSHRTISDAVFCLKKEKVDQIDFPDEYAVAKEVRSYIETYFQVEIPESEDYYLTVLLVSLRANQASGRIGVVVAAHGNSTASSMVQVVQQLLDAENVRAVDMPLDMDPKTALDRIERNVQEVDEGSGVILLVDMGSLASFNSQIQRDTGVPVRTVDMVTTSLV